MAAPAALELGDDHADLYQSIERRGSVAPPEAIGFDPLVDLSL